MPLFMDVHESLPAAPPPPTWPGHTRGRQVQGRYGVDYRRYWVDEADGKAWCLVEAPDAEAASAVHREAHGLVADRLFPVIEGP